MRVLLTGGFGYLGGRLAELLATTTQHDLALGTRATDRPAPTAAHATAVTIDWTSDVGLEEACKDTDAVVHLAGMNAADCLIDPVAALKFNGVATARLVRAAMRRHVARFVYVSTAHVYGAALRGSVNEQTAPEPRHPYATSHRAGEDVVRFAHESGALEGIVVRLSNSFGAPAAPDADCWSLVTNDLCRQAVTTRCAALKSSGTHRRDFVPISAACQAITHLLTIPASGLGDGLFNVGGSWAPTMLEMAEFVAERVEVALGFRPQVTRGWTRDDIGDGDLEYCVTKLAATGFTVRREAIVEEMDRLVSFCAQYAGMAPG